MKTLIIIPALNESETIGNIIRNTKRNGWNDILVVDDCSNDNTREAAKKNGADLICLPINLGAWGAIQTGMMFALAKGYSRVVTIDADNQHDPKYIKSMLNELDQNQLDIVIGACLERGSRAKYFIWKIFKKLSGLDIQDLTSGFRAYNRKAMKIVVSDESLILEYQDIGVLLLCKKHGLQLAEIEINMNQRQMGKSRIFHNHMSICRYIFSTLFLIAVKRW